MNVYPGIFAGAGLIRLGVTSSGALSRWSQSIRDTEFLVEMRLRNYEQVKESEKNENEKGTTVYAEDVTVTEVVGPAAD
jgi:E3 ubiquitin-protein ligase MARCH6